MAADSLFCDVCGASTTTQRPTTSLNEPTPKIGLGSSFFASQANLCLFTLLVFLGLAVALAPAGWRYASLQWKSESGSKTYAEPNDARSLGAPSTPASCNHIVVIFNAAATVARVSALLEQLDTTIAFGPNENGAFELSTPSSKAAAGVNDALNRAADAVVSASLQRRCL